MGKDICWFVVECYDCGVGYCGDIVGIVCCVCVVVDGYINWIVIGICKGDWVGDGYVIIIVVVVDGLG